MEIWLPDAGSLPEAARKVHFAVNEYDERVVFGRNAETGDWCLFIKLPRPMEPYPLFGWQEIPTPQEAVERLQKADTRRHGEEILERVMKSQIEWNLDRKRIAADTVGDVAERVEFELRKNKGTKGHHWSPK